MRLAKSLFLPILFVLLSLYIPTFAQQSGNVTRLTVAGQQFDRGVNGISISDDGRYIAFSSDSTNIVPNDLNDSYDIFLYDRQTDIYTRVSVSSTGIEADSNSYFVTISGDGRYVAFTSNASNLVANDTNSSEDIFLYDHQTAQITRILLDYNGNQITDGEIALNIGISGDGRYISFQHGSPMIVANDTNDTRDIFVHDRQTMTNILVSVDSNGNQGNGHSHLAEISGDGRYVMFLSSATNLVAGDTNDIEDVFLRDLVTGTTTRVSVNSSGGQATYTGEQPFLWTNRMSNNGRFVAFSSKADNLAPNDTNNDVLDLFLHDTQTAQTTLISVSSTGTQINDSDSVSFVSFISNDGRYVIFGSNASNLVPNDTNNKYDTFIRDTQLNTTTLLSLTPAGTQTNGSSLGFFSINMRYMVVTSDASNIVSPDTNNAYDIFIYDRLQLDAPTLIAPANNAITINPNIPFSWNGVADATEYQIQIATDTGFTAIVHDHMLSNTSYPYTVTGADTYYWRVRGKNLMGDGPWSAPYEFIVGTGRTISIDEQELFTIAQAILTDGMTFTLFDITPTGIITTIQFNDGAVVTTMVKLIFTNGLIQIWLEGTSGGTPAQQQIISDRVPALIMNSFDEFMPEGYFLIEGVSMTDTTLNFDVVLSND